MVRSDAVLSPTNCEGLVDDLVGPASSTSGSAAPHCGQNPIHLPDRYPQTSHLKAAEEVTSV
jgi:hypothetical protein